MTQKEHVQGLCTACGKRIYGTRISVRAHRSNCLLALKQMKKGGA